MRRVSKLGVRAGTQTTEKVAIGRPKSSFHIYDAILLYSISDFVDVLGA